MGTFGGRLTSWKEMGENVGYLEEVDSLSLCVTYIFMSDIVLFSFGPKPVAPLQLVVVQ